MVLKIGPDPFTVSFDLNAPFAQQAGFTNAGSLQNGRAGNAPADRITALLARICICCPYGKRAHLWPFCRRTISGRQGYANLQTTRPVSGLAADRRWQWTSAGLSRPSYQLVRTLPGGSRYNPAWRYSQLLSSPQQRRDAAGYRAARV